MKRIFLLLLFLTGIAFGQTRYYFPMPILQSNGRPYKAGNVDLYNAGTTTKAYDLTYSGDSPGLYYTTTSITNAAYDVWVNGFKLQGYQNIYVTASVSDISSTQAAVTAATDTVQLKLLSAANDSLSTMRYLKQISSANTNGGGWFVYGDSATYRDIYGTGINLSGLSYPTPTANKRWYRQQYLETRVINIDWMGAVAASAADSTTNRLAIQNAIDAANQSPNGYGAEVLIPGGEYYVGKVPGSSPAYCIDPLAAHIRGVDSWPSGGSELVMAPNVNGTMFYAKGTADASEWWHGGRIENLLINCNGANNTTANGIDVYRPGEVSYISSVQISGIKGFGYKESRSSTAKTYVENVSFFFDASADSTLENLKRVGIWIIGAGQRNFISLSSDQANPLIYIQGAAQNHFEGIKYEASVDSNAVLVYIDTTSTGDAPDGNTSQLSLNNVKTDPGATGLRSIFKINTNNAALYPSLAITNSMISDVDSFVIGNHNGTKVPVSNQMTRAFYYSGNNEARYQYHTTQFIHYPQQIAFQDHTGAFTGKIIYNTDQIFHIESPSASIQLEDEDQNVLMKLHNFTGIESRYFHSFEAGIEIDSTAALSTPSADRVRLYLTGNGSGTQLLLVKFANGDVDTVATSAAP